MKILRKANADDLDSIYLMGVDVWSDGNSREEYLAGCSASPKYKRGTWYVLEENGILLSSLITYEIKMNTFGIGSIATPESIRKRGYASILISKVIKYLEQGKNQAQVFLYSDINPAFYERFGFKRLPDVAQKYKESICMMKGVSPGGFVGTEQAPDYF